MPQFETILKQKIISYIRRVMGDRYLPIRNANLKQVCQDLQFVDGSDWKIALGKLTWDAIIEQETLKNHKE